MSIPSSSTKKNGFQELNNKFQLRNRPNLCMLEGGLRA